MKKFFEKSPVIELFPFRFTVARTLLAASLRKDFLSTSKIGALYKFPLTFGD